MGTKRAFCLMVPMVARAIILMEVIASVDSLPFSDESFFPIEIIYMDNGVVEIVKNPEDIESGRPFKVLETRVYGN